MYHLLAAQLNTGGAVTNSAMTRALDPTIDSDGTSFRFTERYKLFGALMIGATVTRGRLNAPSLNNVVQHQIEHINRALTIQDQTVPADYLDEPYRLPLNEPVAVEVSDTAAEQTQALLWIAPESWKPTHPTFRDPLGLFPESAPMLARFTSPPTSVANAWVNDQAITFETTPRGGWYAVVGLDAFRANGLAIRLNFRRGPNYNGRRMRPGVICRESLATRPVPYDKFTKRLGLLGYFHTQELPTLDLLASDAAATLIEGRMLLKFVSTAGQDSPPFVGY